MPQIQQTGEASWIIINDNGVAERASSFEVNYAQALLEHGWSFKFIVNFYITPSRALEIDFEIFSVPKVTFVFIDGLVWHSGFNATHDEWERLMLFAKTKDWANPPLTVKNPDCDTLEAARKHVLKNLGRR